MDGNKQTTTKYTKLVHFRDKEPMMLREMKQDGLADNEMDIVREALREKYARYQRRKQRQQVTA